MSREALRLIQELREGRLPRREGPPDADCRGGELALAAVSYLLAAVPVAERDRGPFIPFAESAKMWPWREGSSLVTWSDRSRTDRLRLLAAAGALVVAEMERELAQRSAPAMEIARETWRQPLPAALAGEFDAKHAYEATHIGPPPTRPPNG